MAEPNEPGDDDPWADALAEQADAEGGGSANELLGGGGSAPIGFDGIGDDDRDAVDLDMILDIPVTISMEIGRTQISIRNLLKLNQGSVVELDRLAGEPLDVLVNGTLIAHGEVVVVNEKFGIRLTDVITAMERIQKLT
ncbi:MAG: flagellar motor switch protein FliN [Gammaproteobacteria bacterium]|nr:flagellar motor switch protein FliN [Gammaproteobacteria bacterium]